MVQLGTAKFPPTALVYCICLEGESRDEVITLRNRFTHGNRNEIGMHCWNYMPSQNFLLGFTCFCFHFHCYFITTSIVEIEIMKILSNTSIFRWKFVALLVGKSTVGAKAAKRCNP